MTPQDARTDGPVSRRARRDAEREVERELLRTGQVPILTRKEIRRQRAEAEAMRNAIAAGEITEEEARALQNPYLNGGALLAPAPAEGEEGAVPAPAATEGGAAEDGPSTGDASTADSVETAESTEAPSAPVRRAVLRVLVTDRVAPGQPFAPMHWTAETAPTGRVDALVPALTDPVSGQPALKSAQVAIRPFAAAWYGFAVSAGPITPRADYWARATLPKGQHVELAGGALPEDWIQEARALFGLTGDPLVMQDRRRGLVRLAFAATNDQPYRSPGKWLIDQGLLRGDVTWPGIRTTLAAISASWLDHLEKRLDIGTVAVACALGYLDFRFPDLNWRQDNAKLAAWYATLAQRPSFIATEPADG